MSVIVERRFDGSLAFSLDGDLQFDSRDEAIYHENLVLPALSIVRQRGLSELRVLICGGGDGLALRDVLGFPGVRSVDLVDLSCEVVDLGRTDFAYLNRDAFTDPRVTVHIQDAWEFLARSSEYDVIIADFSMPRRSGEARVFSAEFYALAAAALSAKGILAVNAVSPQRTPAAFWCQVRTIRASGLNPVPFRSCIPSFRERGYGVWGVVLGSKAPLSSRVLRRLNCPVPTRQSDLNRLWRGARFSRAERMLGRLVPVHRVDKPCLVDLLLSRAVEGMPEEPWANLPPPLRSLFETLPVSHPYHTRLMVQTLAENVAESVSQLQLGQLLDELLTRAARLPKRIVAELQGLKESFNEWASWQNWGSKILTALVLVLTLANTLAPDHAFAKASGSFGHASFSRSGSFGRVGNFNSSGPTQAISIQGSGFRSISSTGMYQGRPVVMDMGGDLFPRRTFFYHSYYHPYYHDHYYDYRPSATGPHGREQPPQPHVPVFVADDDLLVMDTGDVVITLGDAAYLLISNGQMQLVSGDNQPLVDLNPDYDLLSNIRAELKSRTANTVSEAQLREDWLSWVGWTSVLLPDTRADKQELANLKQLKGSLDLASSKLVGMGAPSSGKPTNATLLFVGCFLFDDHVEFDLPNDKRATLRGNELVDAHGNVLAQVTPDIHKVLKAVIAKLMTDIHADIAANQADTHDLLNYRNSLLQDESDYRSYATYYGWNYMVDYGTSEIPARQALLLTNTDLSSNASLLNQNQHDATQLQEDLRRLNQAQGWFQ